ncbi:MAG TPA: ferrochelatase [Thermoanaerobaculia bacterium]|nr:ferrochelatase [Thermoanaerobaculia bacterium]
MADRAVLFLQLGGPETLDDVPGFLYRLFSDPDVIRVRPALLRKGIAAAIALGRKKASRALYASIGGGSPIRRLTEEQAAGTAKLLAASGRSAEVRAAMTCSAPLVEDVVRDLASSGVRRFLALPLYPQYSLTTTKGSLERSRAAVRRYAPGATLDELGSFPTHPLFVEAHAEGIREEVARFPDPRPEAVELVFSAHSIPKKLVTRGGDPYAAEVEASMRAILARLAWAGPATLAYQSKLGPVEWLGPPTSEVLAALGRRGRRQVLVVPIAFVTDHVETLQEIDQLFAGQARAAGIEHFRRTPGLNDRPTFLRALADLVSSADAFWRP